MRGERQRLLREAAHLREYLPKGMLRDMEDLRLVQEAADQQQMQQGTGPPGGLGGRGSGQPCAVRGCGS